MNEQPKNAERCTVQADVPHSVLTELDAIVSDIQAKSPGRVVRRAEVVRDCLLLGLKERKRNRKRGGA